ncbi:MAG TPA: site-2 protease family protein [Candidatus Limnocylindria bacterium]|nr:site-2 protease family protein [Candidatus Limnocylindria bacterium]
MLFSNPDPPLLVGIVVALLAGITFHEFSHALLADQLGDHRPRALGRVSLNPLRHLEPLGAIFFLIAGFGWGKPVPVNAYSLRPGRIGMTIVAAAGPLANFALAALVAVLFRVLQLGGLLDSEFLRLVVASIVFFNVALGLFNLIPIPPLDGYNVVLPLLPPRQAFAVQRYAPYGYVALLVLVLLSYGAVSGPLDWLFGLAGTLSGYMLGA